MNRRSPLVLCLALPIMLGIVLLTPSQAGAQADIIAKRLQRSAALIGENRIEEAEQELKLVLKVTPNQAEALNLLGTIRGQEKRLDEAETLFLHALRIDGQLVSAHMNLALLYLLKGLPDRTVSELREVLRLEPGNREAAYKLARLLLSQDQAGDCIDFIEKARKSPALSTPFLIVLLGDAYLKKGNAEKAEESYLLALNEQADSEDALLGLAQVAQLRGDAKTLPIYLSRAKDLAAGSPDLLYNFAAVALKLGAYREAGSALEEAVKLRPRESAYFMALGVIWLNKADVFEAEQAFRRALALQPDSAQGQVYLGYALLRQKKYPEARALLEKSIKGDASKPEAFYYLGLIAQEENEDVRAVEFLTRASQLSPSFGYAHIALGTTYLKLKNYSRAQEELERGVKLNPDEPKAHYQLALLYARLKDPQRAQEEMRIVEKLKDTGETQGKGNIVLIPSGPNPR